MPRSRASDAPLALTPAELAELVERTGAGDRGAFARLYDEMAPRMLGLASRILIDRALAEDALQEAFLQVWRQAGSFDRSRGGARTWIMTIAHHRAVDSVRTRSGATTREQQAGLREIPLDRDVVADDVGDRAEARILHGALAALTPVQRRVLALAYEEGRTQAEIAEITGAPLGTVKSRTRDALHRLRRSLQPAA